MGIVGIVFGAGVFCVWHSLRRDRWSQQRVPVQCRIFVFEVSSVTVHRLMT